MALTLDGTTGVSAVQAGAVESGDLASGAIGSGDLPAGSVIQVVQDIANVETQIQSTSYVDTGLSGTITPKFASSKILIITSQNAVARPTGGIAFNVRLFKNGNGINDSTTSQFVDNDTAPGADNTSLSIVYLDSPSTTSSLTYNTRVDMQFSNRGPITFQRQGLTQGTSTITLMEIAG